MSAPIRRLLRALRTLRVGLFLALALVGILPLAVMILGGASLSRRIVAEQSTRELTGLARGLAGQLDMYLFHLLQDAQAIAALPDIASMDPARQNALLKELVHQYTEFSRLSVFALDGRPIASSAPTLGVSIAERPWFQQAVARGEQTWAVAQALSGAGWMLAINTPIRGADRRIVGVLGTVVRLENLAEATKRVSIGGGGRAFALDADGRLLLHPDAELIQQRPDYSWLGLSAGGQPAGPATISYVRDGVAYVAGFAPISSVGWTIVVERPEAEVLAPAEQLWRLALAGLVVSIVLALLGALLLASILTRPVRQLATATRAFAAGDPTAPLPSLEPDDELGMLVATFAAMRADVAARTAALERLRAASALLHRTADLDSTLDALVTHAMALTGAASGALALLEDGDLVVRHRAGVLATIAADALPLQRATLEAVCRSGEPLVINDATDPRLAPPGPSAYRVHNVLLAPLVTRGRTFGVLGVCNKRGLFTAEDQRLLAVLASETAIVLENATLMQQAARAAALEELNRQQRLIINMIAHELRTPLSYMVGYSELLLHRQPSPELLREGLSAIYRGALQLRDVVTDIVELLQLEAGQLILEWQDVDLGHLVPRWVAELASPPRVVVRVGAGVPAVRGDPVRLRHVVNHLVRNALKFSPSDTTVEVEVERAGPAEVVLRVRDRGIGIASAEAEKVFDLFYRTPQAHADAVPGSGLGLALVKRLVEMHQGRVTVQSALGEGSVFTVALRAAVA
jgi:signal transduction histidine kinase